MNMIVDPAKAVFQAFNPKGRNFLSAYWLSPRVLTKEMLKYDIRIALVVAFELIPHLKFVPAYFMLLAAYTAGLLKDVEWIVVDSSGNTAHGVIRLAIALGFKVKVILKTDTPGSKRGMLEVHPGTEVIAVSSNVAARAREEAQKPRHFHLNQYADPNNLKAHFEITGPELVRALSTLTSLSAFYKLFVPMGTGGTAGGIAKFLKQHHPHIEVVGVRPNLGEDVPGARDRERMRESQINWQEFVDERKIIEVSRKDSFIATRKLWHGIPPQVAPTGAMAYAAAEKDFEHYLGTLDVHQLEMLRGKAIAVLCPDDGRFYTDVIKAELRPEQGELTLDQVPAEALGPQETPSRPIWGRPT